MKNVTTTSVKVQAQSMAVSTVKAVVCIPHIILQSSADLLSIGEAKVINLIDGTPIIVSVMHRQSYTQEKMANTIKYAMDQKAKVQAKLDSYRQQDIDKLKTKLDKLEGVEHIAPTMTPEEAFILNKPKVTLTPKVEVPAPPVFIPINKRGPKAVPTMTVPATV